MASLREIKDRISSVKSTLKITGAMKLVASAKLRKAQAAAAAMIPYEKALSEALSHVVASESISREGGSLLPPGAPTAAAGESNIVKRAVVVLTSNSSRCGAFNANAVRLALQTVDKAGNCDVFAVGRKGAEALRKLGLSLVGDWNDLAGKPSYKRAAELARSLVDAYESGLYSEVLLVYNHFVSTGVQRPQAVRFLPFEWEGTENDIPEDIILEPDAETLLQTLLPKVLNLKVYAALLDSVAAEHAARTIAMQTASDNAEDLLGDLTLEYNKGRQQKITSEILDLLGGKAG